MRFEEELRTRGVEDDMSKCGKWYIAFDWLNDFEPRGGTIEHEEIMLKATTEDEAIAEADAIASSGENVKTSYGVMPVPGGYSVIYKVSPSP